MIGRLWRVLRPPGTDQCAKLASEQAQAALEQRVSAQLVAIFAYMDRMRISRGPTESQQHGTGEPSH